MVVCVFWDIELSVWSDAGCRVAETSALETTCECSHLTNFAVLAGVVHDDPIIANVMSDWVICALIYVPVAVVLLLAAILAYRVSQHEELIARMKKS